MYLERFYDDDLAQASYLVGSERTGEAIVVDPRRDVHVYLEAAAARKLRIVAVTETHVHADYLSGSRELAQAAGADLYLSAEGGADWRYRFDHLPLHDGDVIEVGDVTLTAMHTPGHTPEHLSFLVTDLARSEEPAFLLSGDFVFVGDVGRPDLLDE
ncbi:MAG TPA: MBL fold metallo-hydrolase, partial [Trueperaceae bacterium]|nr:MBL fold metallo-hydrolase [Trueperaceae bacterium]